MVRLTIEDLWGNMIGLPNDGDVTIMARGSTHGNIKWKEGGF
jgi:hypothetical protein